MPRISIRASTDGDLEAILDVHATAFGELQGREIANLVRALLGDRTARPIWSLLAVSSGRIAGHMIFSSVRIPGASRSVRAQILAPLAVLPAWQRRGVGSDLIRHGLGQLAEAGTELVFVLGHPEYYPRFGFEPAGVHGLDAPYPIPQEHRDAWMVQALQPGVLGQVRGTIQCARALSNPAHW